MRKIKILITVKTAPLLSRNHIETVCTAGLTEQGQWIRLYPISYRFLDKTQRFSKYQWIEALVERDVRDQRPESYKLKGSITPLGKIGVNDGWQKRKGFVLGRVDIQRDD